MQGCDEAVFLREGIVTECSKSNISIIKDGKLKTHPLSIRILPGIVRKHLLLACKKIGVQVFEAEFTKEDLLDSDEVLISSTTKLVKRAESIDGIKIGMKNASLAEKICQNLYSEYENLVCR